MPTVYDKAKYHFEGDFPSDLSESQAYVHTGLFVAWLAENGLMETAITDSCKTTINSLAKREVLPSTLFRQLDGVFDNDDVTDEGRRFCDDYFDFDAGNFLDDYIDTLSSLLPSMYHVPDSWASYDRIAPRFAERFRQWKKG